MPIISVVIVSLNEGEYLHRTVDSFLSTLPCDGEVIVVDDGSTDGSADFLTAGRERVRLVRSMERLGVARARNFGAQHIRGEVVVFSDAHVEVPVNWHGPLLNVLARSEVGAVAPGISIMQPAPVESTGYGQKWRDASLETAWLGLQQWEAHAVPLLGGAFIALRGEVFAMVRGFDSGMELWGAEDSEFCIRLWTVGYECMVVPSVDVAHRFRPQRPYAVRWEEVIHNKLRLAALHFRPERIRRVADYFKQNAAFSAASARVASSNVRGRRSEIDSVRVYDDDWFFRKFERELKSDLSEPP